MTDLRRLVRSPTDLRPRVISGAILVVAALVATWAGGFLFLAFWAIAAFGVAFEWQRLIGGPRLMLRIALAEATLLALAPWASWAHTRISLGILLCGCVAVGVVARERRWAAVAGVPYAGAVLLAPLLLRGSPTQGLAAVLWLYAVVWGTDIAAYFGGRALRGPKLWPAISPGKTWSGALVGVAVAAVLGLLVAAVATPGGVRIAPLLILGAVASMLSQAGDLFESALKRRAGVKDSGRLIPGHGGLMDRLDGFIVAATFAAVVAWTRSQGPWIAPGLLKW